MVRCFLTLFYIFLQFGWEGQSGRQYHEAGFQELRHYRVLRGPCHSLSEQQSQNGQARGRRATFTSQGEIKYTKYSTHSSLYFVSERKVLVKKLKKILSGGNKSYWQCSCLVLQTSTGVHGVFQGIHFRQQQWGQRRTLGPRAHHGSHHGETKRCTSSFKHSHDKVIRYLCFLSRWAATSPKDGHGQHRPWLPPVGQVDV